MEPQTKRIRYVKTVESIDRRICLTLSPVKRPTLHLDSIVSVSMF